jgi:hypothetical protein
MVDQCFVDFEARPTRRLPRNIPQPSRIHHPTPLAAAAQMSDCSGSRALPGSTHTCRPERGVDPLDDFGAADPTNELAARKTDVISKGKTRMLLRTSLNRGFARAAGLCLIATLPWLTGCGDDDGAKPAAADGGVTTGSGASGEVCSPDKLCADGLVCSSGRCAAGGALTLSVDSAARGCELVLTDGPKAKVTEVRFGDGVKGSYVRRAPRVGLSFIAAKDEAIPGAQISLVVAGDGQPTVARTTCVDSKGKALPKAAVSVSK